MIWNLTNFKNLNPFIFPGFIVDIKTKDSIFVHINNTEEPIQQNDKVTFEVENGPKGPNAVNVKLMK